jgi:hypothetical protein
LAVILHRLVKWVIGFFQSTDGLRVENDAIPVWTWREREGIIVYEVTSYSCNIKSFEIVCSPEVIYDFKQIN